MVSGIIFRAERGPAASGMQGSEDDIGPAVDASTGYIGIGRLRRPEVSFMASDVGCEPP